MRILFMGTPYIAARVLKELSQSEHEIVGVFTQPDKARNRGMKETASEVKVLAEQLSLPVYQPETFKNQACLPILEELKPDLIAVVAYGKILPSYVLEFPRYGCINLHGSLLPKYRGAAPIQRALMACEAETGVTVMKMDKGIDTGDMFTHAKVAIAPDDTTESLTCKLAEVGAPLFVETIAAIEAGTLTARKQDDACSCYASMLNKEDGIIDWTKNAEIISAQIRGCDPWPTAETTVDGMKLKLFMPQVVGIDENSVPGTIISANKKGFVVACGGGTLLKINEVQPSGKKRMPAFAYFNGHPLKENKVL